MTNEDFRRELGHVFDSMAGSPSTGLGDRVRASLTEPPTQRGPFWIAGVAAAVLAAVIIGVLFVANPLHRPPGAAGPGTIATPSPSASASASPPASASGSPYVCQLTGTGFTGEASPPVAFIDALRTGTHSGYDRLTVEFQNGVPASIDVTPQSGTTFTTDPLGQAVTLAGTSGILVTIHGADLHTSYNGPADIKTGYSKLVEVRRVQDFEGVVQLGIGIQGPACYRAYMLTAPDRLVIDVQTP